MAKGVRATHKVGIDASERISGMGEDVRQSVMAHIAAR